MIKLLLPCYILSPLLSFHKDCVKTTWHVSKLIMLTVNTARPISLWPVFVYLAVRPLWRNQKCWYYLQYMLRGQSSWCLTHHEITSKEMSLFWTVFFCQHSEHFCFVVCLGFFFTFFFLKWHKKWKKVLPWPHGPAYVMMGPISLQWVRCWYWVNGMGWVAYHDYHFFPCRRQPARAPGTCNLSGPLVFVIINYYIILKKCITIS